MSSLATPAVTESLPAPLFTPTRLSAPADWPSLWQWLGISRRNALALFPQACYEAPLVHHRIVGRRLVVLNDPASIREVFGSQAGRYRLTNMHLRMLTPALRAGVIVAQGESWKQQRRVALRLVKESDGRPTGALARIDAMIDQWAGSRDGQDISDPLTALAIDLLAMTLFDHRPVAEDIHVLGAIRRHRHIIEAADILDLLGAPIWLPSPKMRRARKVVASYYPVIDRAVAESRRFTPPPQFTRPQIQDFVINMMSGFESVAVTTIWLLALIARSQPLQNWLTDPSAGEAERQGRLEASIKEVMRLYPPLPVIYRHAIADHHSPAGFIAKGSMVCISPYLVHRHQRNWAQPDMFDPLRFETAPPDGSYIPFGYGARQCVGRQLGPALVKEIVGRVLSRLHLASDGHPLQPPRAGISLRPGAPPHVLFRARTA